MGAAAHLVFRNLEIIADFGLSGYVASRSPSRSAPVASPQQPPGQLASGDLSGNVMSQLQLLDFTFFSVFRVIVPGHPQQAVNPYNKPRQKATERLERLRSIGAANKAGTQTHRSPTGSRKRCASTRLK
jgi:hypothetical protein